MFNPIHKINKLFLRVGAFCLCFSLLLYASVLDINSMRDDDSHTTEKSVYESTITYTPAETSQDRSAYSSIQLPTGEINKNKDIYNFLLLGTDEREDNYSENARADAILLLSVNKKEHTVKLVSLERGIAVPIPGQEDDWLTHTFRYGGADLTLQTVRNCFKVDVDRYARVNFSVFENIVNAVGGVDITLTEVEAKALNNELYTNAVTKQKVVAGLNHLDGYDTLQYCRLRFVDSDWNRIERQRTAIQAAINQAKKLNIKDMTVLVYQVFSQIETNITAPEVAMWLFELPSFSGVQAKQMTIPLKGTYWGKTASDGKSLIMVDFAENAKKLNEFICQSGNDGNR